MAVPDLPRMLARIPRLCNNAPGPSKTFEGFPIASEDFARLSKGFQGPSKNLPTASNTYPGRPRSSGISMGFPRPCKGSQGQSMTFKGRPRTPKVLPETLRGLPCACPSLFQGLPWAAKGLPQALQRASTTAQVFPTASRNVAKESKGIRRLPTHHGQRRCASHCLPPIQQIRIRVWPWCTSLSGLLRSLRHGVLLVPLSATSPEPPR